MRHELKSCSLPRWRMTGWLTDPGHDVPPDIRLALIKSLYGTLPIFAGGVINTIAVSALIAARIPEPTFIGWLLFEVLLCATRLFVLLHCYRAGNEGRRTPTDLYIMLGVLWAASVGFGTFISVTSGDWVSATLACLSAAAMVGGICFRNYGAPRLVAAMILLSLGPCALGAVLSGEPILLIVAVQIPFYLVSMTMAAYRLNGILLATMLAERENDHRARHDTLTGVLNRAGLVDALEASLAKPVSGSSLLTLFYLDLDGFKPVNDAFGHGAGDRLLQLVADRLKHSSLGSSLVARLGGDEFVVVSTVADAQAALAAGEALIDAVSGAPYDIGAGRATIGVSVGIAFVPEHGADVGTLLNAADTALYEAKSRGRRCCAIATGPAGADPDRHHPRDAALLLKTG